MARSPVMEPDTAMRLTLNVRNICLTDDQLYRLCCDYPELRIELTADGDLIVMSPATPGTGRRNAIITGQLYIWTRADGTGECFDSNSEFSLPDGAKRAPDASWISNERWNRLPKEEREDKFSVICPDFVVELRSPSDNLRDVRSKLEEYISNGAKLGWLIDPIENRATIYRPGQPPQEIEEPATITGDPVLPGFNFNFKEIL